MSALLQQLVEPRNFGALDDATHRAEGHNPLCGDHLSVALQVAGERVERIASRASRARSARPRPR